MAKKSGNHNDISKRGAITPVSKGAGVNTTPKSKDGQKIPGK